MILDHLGQANRQESPEAGLTGINRIAARLPEGVGFGIRQLCLDISRNTTDKISTREVARLLRDAGCINVTKRAGKFTVHYKLLPPSAEAVLEGLAGRKCSE